MRSTARYRKTMVMRDHLSAAAVLSVVGVLSSFPASPAQASSPASCSWESGLASGFFLTYIIESSLLSSMQQLM